MELQNKHCIINASNGNGWYPRGTKRLKNSLIHHGFNGDVLSWYDWPNDEFDKSCPYNIKASAFVEAIRLGYTHILWLDCSVWAVGDINKIFDTINEQGYYLQCSGYNCAQTCNDDSLKYFALTRDSAEKINDCSSAVLGVNLRDDKGKVFMETFIQSARDGIFKGSRLHDNQSIDPRFLFHRQDQSCASLIAGILGMEFNNEKYAEYYSEKLNESTILTMRGM